VRDFSIPKAGRSGLGAGRQGNADAGPRDLLSDRRRALRRMRVNSLRVEFIRQQKAETGGASFGFSPSRRGRGDALRDCAYELDASAFLW
jgi:hypothetical protein